MVIIPFYCFSVSSVKGCFCSPVLLTLFIWIISFDRLVLTFYEWKLSLIRKLHFYMKYIRYCDSKKKSYEYETLFIWWNIIIILMNGLWFVLCNKLWRTEKNKTCCSLSMSLHVVHENERVSELPVIINGIQHWMFSFLNFHLF